MPASLNETQIRGGRRDNPSGTETGGTRTAGGVPFHSARSPAGGS